MSAPRPIEIVGGGLAGLALGLALRRAEVAVAILEAGAYPRHRVGGEFITGLDQGTIDQLALGPLLVDALSHREVAWHRHDRIVRIQKLPRPALGISRYALDARLANAFIAAGGDLRCNTRALDLAPHEGRVLAIGRHRGKPAWIGLKVHVRHLRLAADLELHLGDDAYVGLSPVEDGAINLCGLFRQRRIEIGGESPTPERADTLLAYLRAANLGRLADRVTAADIEAESFCAVAALEFGRVPAIPNGITIGDACAMIPPFTGNGMAMAFQSAAITLGPLARYAQGTLSWEEACRECSERMRRRFRLRLASAEALHPFLLRPIAQRVLTLLSRASLLPLRPLYAAMH
jgi:menaquinone-9 beta-reductase